MLIQILSISIYKSESQIEYDSASLKKTLVDFANVFSRFEALERLNTFNISQGKLIIFRRRERGFTWYLSSIKHSINQIGGILLAEKKKVLCSPVL